MLSFLVKYRQICLLTLCVLLGLACSHLAMVLLGTAGRGQAPAPLLVPLRTADRAAPETELAFILQLNLFDQTARRTTPIPFSLQAGETSVTQGDLELAGTVVAGSRSLAMIRTGQELKIYRLGAELPGGKLEEVARHQVSIRNNNGSMAVLKMREVEPSRPPGASGAGSASGRPAAKAPGAAGAGIDSSAGKELPADGTAVRTAGENRWIVARRTAAAARENIGTQLRTAQMQPNLVDGKTNGFVISRIQPGTLLAQMGLQPGDVIMRVNNMPLDSPEKALQVMQQLREARQITIDLERGGSPRSFAYEIE